MHLYFPTTGILVQMADFVVGEEMWVGETVGVQTPPLSVSTSDVYVQKIGVTGRFISRAQAGAHAAPVLQGPGGGEEATSFEEGGMGRVRSPQWSRRAREHARRCSAGRRAPGVQPAGMRGGVVRTMRLSSSAVIFCTLLQQ